MFKRHREFFNPLFPWLTVALLFVNLAKPIYSESGTISLESAKQSKVPNGNFIPPFLSDTLQALVPVDAFLLDQYPVTQKQFAQFVRRNPEWKRTGKSSLFKDANYLQNWENDSTPKPENLKTPVTFISWHAAKAYCADIERRLPTTMEWERVAQTFAPSTDSLTMLQEILDWYGKPAGLGLDTIGSGTTHAFGIHDLHALIWEWTSDYRSWGYAKFGTANGEDSAQFCGAGGNRKNSNDFIIYMRYGFRSSLEPHFAVAALGFRCAADFQPR